LAREFGINQQTALDHLHRRGVAVIRSRVAIADDQLPELRELYEDGLSLKQLAETYDCSHTAVSAALKRGGVPIRQTWSLIPPHKIVELEALRAQGWTYQAIGERYGCSRWTVAKGTGALSFLSDVSILLAEVAGQFGKDSSHGVGINRWSSHRPNSQPRLGLPRFDCCLQFLQHGQRIAAAMADRH
jgi:hypothetical protein